MPSFDFGFYYHWLCFHYRNKKLKSSFLDKYSILKLVPNHSQASTIHISPKKTLKLLQEYNYIATNLSNARVNIQIHCGSFSIFDFYTFG